MVSVHFSERLQRVVAHAHDEALGLNHEYVSTEHILLALMRDADGVVAEVLRAHSVNTIKARQLVLDAMEKGRAPVSIVNLPYTSRGKKTMELAMWQAREWRHDYVGPEHMLIGLLREKNGIGAQVLFSAGVTLEGALAHTFSILGEQR